MRERCAPLAFPNPLRGSVALDAAFMSRVTELGNRNCVTHDRSYRLLGVDEEAPGASHGASSVSSAHARVSTRPGTAQCGARILKPRACGPALLPADAPRAASACGSVDRAAAGLVPPRVDTASFEKRWTLCENRQSDFGTVGASHKRTSLVASAALVLA